MLAVARAGRVWHLTLTWWELFGIDLARVGVIMARAGIEAAGMCQAAGMGQAAGLG